MNILDKIKTMTIEEYAKFVNDDYIVACCQSLSLQKQITENLSQEERDTYFEELYAKALQQNWEKYLKFQGNQKKTNFFQHRQRLKEFIDDI